MRLASLRFLLPFIVVISLLTSCSDYEKVLKSPDVNYKLTKANEYYDKKWYIHANELYKSLLPVMKGTKNYEPLYYKFTYSYYYQKDYLDAAYHFKNFTDFFPASKDAEEAEYMHAYCLYKMAPKPSLEQANTIKAMEALQSFINTHPESKRIAEANKLIDESRKKLESKEAISAKLYFDIAQYKAAAQAYKGVIDQYPESPNADYYQYMVLKSLYLYAGASIETKQEERFSNAVAAYRDLKDAFPKSAFLQPAEQYAVLSQATINKIRNEHPQ